MKGCTRGRGVGGGLALNLLNLMLLGANLLNRGEFARAGLAGRSPWEFA